MTQLANQTTTGGTENEQQRRGETRGPLSLAEKLAQAEQDLVLKTFEELKRRGDGEMRVAIRREKGREIPEITYCGIHEKADLESLRAMYRELAKKGSRF